MPFWSETLLMSQADDVLVEVLSTVLQLKAMLGRTATTQSLQQMTRLANKHAIGYACICIAEQADAFWAPGRQLAAHHQ